jgi:hypothetical protein
MEQFGERNDDISRRRTALGLVIGDGALSGLQSIGDLELSKAASLSQSFEAATERRRFRFLG